MTFRIATGGRMLAQRSIVTALIRRHDLRVATDAARMLGFVAGREDYRLGRPAPIAPEDIPDVDLRLPDEERKSAEDFVVTLHYDAGAYDGWWDTARADLAADLDRLDLREAA